MKKLEIRDKFKSLSRFGRMLALTGTISASAICFSGCGSKEIGASLEKDGQRLQLLRLTSGYSCAWKVGYFSVKEDDLYFVNAFEEKEETNLSYLSKISDEMEISYCDYANMCNTDLLLSYKISESQSEDIIKNVENKYDEVITSNSKYSCRDEVTLKKIKDDSYEDIIKNTKLEKAPQKKKK